MRHTCTCDGASISTTPSTVCASTPRFSPSRFTGKERDTESGNDYFGARYYASAMGRWMSPDWSEKVTTVPYADLANPQSLNLYSYVTNNPMNRTDPMGHDWFYVDKKWQWQKGGTFHDANGNATKDKGYQYLLVFNKTGTNKYGAATGTLTLYNQNKEAAPGSYVFSGGHGSDGGGPPIPNGNYFIHLDVKGDYTGTYNDIGTKLPNFYGIQTLHQGGGLDVSNQPWVNDPTWQWGGVRAALNHPIDGNPADQGDFLHGKHRPEDYTHGCICERSEVILHMLQGLSVPVVPTEVK